MKQIRAIFITGFLVLVPLLATIQLLAWLVHSVDSNVRHLIPDFISVLDFWGSGILIALILIFFTGFLAQNYVGTWILNGLDSMIRKIALVGGIYSSIKKFLETIFSPKGTEFHGTVLVEFPRKGIYSIGFRTGKPDTKLTKGLKEKDLVNIFVPCTPNPTSGFYLLVPEQELVPLDLSVQEAFKLVISLGIVTSEDAEKAPS